MWILLTLVCAGTQATWMAFSKLRLRTLGRLRFTVFLRAPLVPLMVPFYLAFPRPALTPRVGMLIALAAGLECARLLTLATGFRKDYYATYSLMNTAPLWVLALAPGMLGERLTVPVLTGGALVVAGGFVFYRTSRFVPAGVVAAVIEAFLVTVSKQALEACQAPMFFMFWMYTSAAVSLTAGECLRAGCRTTWTEFRSAFPRVGPLSILNLAAMLTYMTALHLAAASRFAILLRSNMVFGFILSLVLLHEWERWGWRLAGAMLIVCGAGLITVR